MTDGLALVLGGIVGMLVYIVLMLQKIDKRIGKGNQ